MDGFLCEARLERRLVLGPPRAVEGLDHHFDDDDIIALDTPVVFPESVRWGSEMRSDAAESLDKFFTYSAQHIGSDGAAVLLTQWQEQLHEMSGGSHRSLFAALPG